jgi:IQ calmodulin-binding motif
MFASLSAAMPRQWVLRSVTDATKVHKLIGPSFRVGSASTANLCIAKLDEQHAVIDISAAGTAILRDAGGAQGVFFAEGGRGRLEQLNDDEEVEMEKGDAVRFGSEQENTYTVEQLQCPTKLAVTVLGVDHITADAKSSTPRSVLGAKQMLIHITLELCSVTASTAAVKCTSSKVLFGTSGEVVEIVVPDSAWTAGFAPIEHAVKLTVYNGKVALGSIVTTFHRLQAAAQQDRGIHCELSSTAQGFVMLSKVSLQEVDATAAVTTAAVGASQTTPNKNKASGIAASKSFFRNSPRNNADASSTADSNTTAAAAAAQSPSNSSVMHRLGSAFLASPRSMANVLADKMTRKPAATTTAAAAAAAAAATAADDHDAESNSDNNDDNIVAAVDNAADTDANDEQYEALIIRFTAIEARNLAECTPKSIIGARKKKGVTQDPHVAITAAGVSAKTAPVIGGATKPVFGQNGDGESLTLVIIGSVWSASLKGAADCSKLPLKIDVWNGELLLGTVEKTLTTLVKAAQLNGTGIVDLIYAKGKQQGLLEYSIAVEGGNIDQSVLMISNDATAAVDSNDDSDTALNSKKQQQQQLKGSNSSAATTPKSVTKGVSPLGSKRNISVRKGGGISDSNSDSDNDSDGSNSNMSQQQQHSDNVSDSESDAAAASMSSSSRLKAKQPAVTAHTATAAATAKRTTAVPAVAVVKTPRSPSIATSKSTASQSAAAPAAAPAAKVDTAVVSASKPTAKAVVAPTVAQQAAVAAQQGTAATGVSDKAIVKDNSRPAPASIQLSKPATAGASKPLISSAVSGDNAQDSTIDAAVRGSQADTSVPLQHDKQSTTKADSTNNKKPHEQKSDRGKHTESNSIITNTTSISNEPTAEQLEAEATRLAGVQGKALAEQAIQDELRQERLQRARQIAAKRRADAVHYGPMGRRIYNSSSSYSISGNGSSEHVTAEHTQAATAIQSVWRSKQSRKQLKRQHRSARAIQAAVRGRLDRKKFETLAAKAKAAELDEKIRVNRRRRIAAKEAELKLLTATSARDLQKLDALRQHASARTLQQWWCKRTSSSSTSSGAMLRRSSAKKRVKNSSTATDKTGTDDDDNDMLYYTVPNRSVAIAAQRKESRHRYSAHQHAYDHSNSSTTTTAADRLSGVYKRIAAAANSTVTDNTVAHSMAHAAATTASGVNSESGAQLQDSSYSSRLNNSVHHKYETLLNAREQSNDLLLQRQNDAVRQQAASKRRAELLQNFKELQLQLTHLPKLTTAATATAAPISSVHSVTAATATRQWLPTDSKALARAVKSHERTVTTLNGKDRWYSAHLNQNSGGRAIDIRTMQSSDWPFENRKQPIKKHRTRYAQYSTAADTTAGTAVADDCEQSLWWHAYASKQREQPLVATADLQQQQQYSSSTTDRVSQKLYELVQLGPIARREATLEYVHAKHDRIAKNVTALVHEVEHRRCDASSGSSRYSTYSRYSTSAVSAKQQHDAATLLQSRARGMSARRQTGKKFNMLQSVQATMLSCALLCDELILAMRNLLY